MQRFIAATAALLALGCQPEDPLLNATFAFCVSPPQSVDFGEVTVREPLTRALIVTNCGNAQAEDVGVTVGPTEDGDETEAEAFKIPATEIPTPLLPGERFDLPVRFRPTEVRDYSAQLLVVVPGFADEGVAAADLSGIGVPPAACDLEIGPSPLNFSSLPIGETETLEVNLTNQGTGPCALSAIQVSDGLDHFTVAREDFELAVGATESIAVTFSPVAAGALEGTLSIIEDGAVEREVDLTGAGEAEDACVLEITPSTLAAPRAAVGFTESIVSAELRSVGALDCSVADVEIESGASDFSIDAAPASDTVLSTGQSASITVRFTPSAPGERAGTLAAGATEGARAEALLSAFADPTPSCVLRFTPSTLSFDRLAVGLTAERDIAFENLSARTCAITDVRVEGGEFVLVDAAATGDLGPGESRTQRVRFLPTIPAPALGSFVVELDDNPANAADLLGFAEEAEVALTPGVAHFEPVTVGCVSRPQTFQLTNLGGVDVRLDGLSYTANTDPNFELLSGPSSGTLIAPGQTRDVEVRMAAAPAPGSNAGLLEAAFTGAVEPRLFGEVFGRTASVDEAVRTDIFTQRERPVVDILFVIDDSGSMGQEQDELAANFASFIQFTEGLDIDYQIGVTTTDTDSAQSAGALVAPIIASDGPNASPDPVADFIAAVNVGTTGSATERGLEAAARGLERAVAGEGLNAGLVRDDALLSIIWVSDEEDNSGGAVTDYTARILDVKDNDAFAVIGSAVAGDVPGGCDANDNRATEGARYFDAALLLNGIFSSVCTADWATTLENLGIQTFEALTRFTLSRFPDLGSGITVVVDGVPVSEDELNGFSYDPETNAIRFSGTAVPDPGQSISVSYTAECLLP